MFWESFDVVKFVLEPLLQAQMRTAEFKSANNSLTIDCNVKPTYRKSWVGNLLMWSHLTLDPSFKVKRQPNLKMLITSGIFSRYVFYYCFYMFAMFGDTTLARVIKASGISLVLNYPCAPTSKRLIV